MATTTDSYTVARLDELEPGPLLAPGTPDDGRVRLAIRTELGITAFGVNAYRGSKGLVREHDELGIGSSEQEELYVVLNGGATFTVDGEQVDAPAGSLVFVRPEAKRSAVATEPDTTVLVIGGTPGKAYDPAPPEVVDAMAAYNTGDYETAVAKQRVVVEKRPNDVLALFNAACFEARLGRTDDAIEHLQRAIEADERIKENIRTDEDLETIREDARFRELVS
jgi:tetratricopeptide (TPR) repeat protein